MSTIAVITGDLVKSRKIKEEDIEPVLNSLKNTFSEINKNVLNNKGSFEIYRGDSFQCLIPYPEKALLIAIIIRAQLRTYEPTTFSNKQITKPIFYAYSDARIAIGLGTTSYNAIRIVESQGEAFNNSGFAFDTLKKENERLTISTPWHEMNEELKVESKLADAIISRWTASTSEAIYHYLLYNKTQQELAHQLNISQPGVHNRLVKYGYIDSIQAFINRYEQLIAKVN